MEKFKIVVCPHTNKEVLGMYNPGDTDGYPDYLCLHNEENPEQDAEDVEHFRKTGKILHNTLFKSILDDDSIK